MSARYAFIYANSYRSVFMCAERFCDAKMNSGKVPVISMEN